MGDKSMVANVNALTINEKSALINGFYDVLGWYSRESVLSLSDLGIHLSRLCAGAAVLGSESIRMKEVYSTTVHSHAAIRKSVQQLVDVGHVEVVCSQNDRRAKQLVFTDEYVAFNHRHTEKIFRHIYKCLDVNDGFLY